MVDFLPYSSIDALFAASDRVSSSLGEADWLEAFLHHPRIGENAAKAAEARHSRGWSEKEQSGMERASQEARAALAELNREYEAKFGFIFLICATGKSAEEMLAQARARLANTRDVELGIAAGEQRKITTLRLEKLVQP
jgi:OHCU decarboxylase